MLPQFGLVLVLSLGLLGQSSSGLDVGTRIIGGQNAPEKVAIHQASIRKQQNNEHICGGSIINKYWILTAGHCTHGQNITDLVIVVGSTKLNSGGDFYKVKKLITHENFSPKDLKNDVGLIRVDGAIVMKNTVRAILLERKSVPPGTTCFLSGWGQTDRSGTVPNQLQILAFQSITNKKCNEMLKQTAYAPIDRKQLCVKASNNKGACKGDGGGPLFASAGKFLGLVQVGIASWGVPCGKNYPDVFTSVSGYYNWIIQITK